MSKKHEGKAEKLFKKLGKKIDGLIEELTDIKTDTGKEFSKKMEELKRNKATFESELKDFRNKNKHKWDEIEQSMENAAAELRKAFSIAFSGRKKAGDDKTETPNNADPGPKKKKAAGKKAKKANKESARTPQGKKEMKKSDKKSGKRKKSKEK